MPYRNYSTTDNQAQDLGLQRSPSPPQEHQHGELGQHVSEQMDQDNNQRHKEPPVYDQQLFHSDGVSYHTDGQWDANNTFNHSPHSIAYPYTPPHVPHHNYNPFSGFHDHQKPNVHQIPQLHIAEVSTNFVPQSRGFPVQNTSDGNQSSSHYPGILFGQHQGNLLNDVLHYQTQASNPHQNARLFTPVGSASNIHKVPESLHIQNPVPQPRSKGRRNPGAFRHTKGYWRVRNKFKLFDCFSDCRLGRHGSRGFERRGNLLAHFRAVHGQDIASNDRVLDSARQHLFLND